LNGAFETREKRRIPGISNPRKSIGNSWNPRNSIGILEIQRIQKESKESDGNPRNTMEILALHNVDV
jgi:hypothetical protein